MSNASTPKSLSGDASPLPISPPPIVSRPSKTRAHDAHAKPTKSANVFSNDGSFLERFQRSKKDEEEKKKQEEIARKRNFNERFKTRGKRPHPDSASSEPATEIPSKKIKSDKPLTRYQKEVKNYAGRSLKDDGIGVRPLVK